MAGAFVLLLIPAISAQESAEATQGEGSSNQVNERATGNFDGSDREITQGAPTQAKQGENGRPVSPEDVPGVRAPKETSTQDQQLGKQPEGQDQQSGGAQSVMDEVRQEALQISESNDSGSGTSLKYPEDFPANI